jgi:hypothetical protein
MRAPHIVQEYLPCVLMLDDRMLPGDAWMLEEYVAYVLLSAHQVELFLRQINILAHRSILHQLKPILMNHYYIVLPEVIYWLRRPEGLNVFQLF